MCTCQGTPFDVEWGCMSVDTQGQLLNSFGFLLPPYGSLGSNSGHGNCPYQLSYLPSSNSFFHFSLYLTFSYLFTLKYDHICLPFFLFNSLLLHQHSSSQPLAFFFFFDYPVVSSVCSAHSVWVWDPQEHRKAGRNETDIARTCYQKSTVCQLYESKGT